MREFLDRGILARSPPYSCVMTVGHLELFVANPNASREWYTDALGAKLVVEQGPYCWISIGEAEVLLRPGAPPPAADYRHSRAAIVLYSQSLEDDLQRLRDNGIALTNGDADECVTFQDPDGNWFQIVQDPS